MKILFLVSIMLSSLLAGNPDNSNKPSNAEKDIDGIYHDDSGLKLNVRDNRCTLFSRLFNIDTVVFDCSYEWVDGKFIVLNSESVYDRLIDKVEVTQSRDPSLVDSVRVTFDIPSKFIDYIYMNAYSHYYLDFTYSYLFPEEEKVEHFALNYRKNETIMLPAYTRSILLDIVTHVRLHPYNTAYTILSPGYRLQFIDIRVKPGMNNIEVRMPTLTTAFFEEHYITGEYARVKGNSITWRGITFVKKVDNSLDKDAFSPSFIVIK